MIKKLLMWLGLIPRTIVFNGNTYTQHQYIPIKEFSFRWVNSKNETVHELRAEIRYWPYSHTISLHGEGNNYEQHDYFIRTVKNMYAVHKRWLSLQDRNGVAAYIRHKFIEIDAKKKKNDIPTMTSSYEDLTIPELRDLIDEKLQHGQFDEIEIIQKIIDKKLSDNV